MTKAQSQRRPPQRAQGGLSLIEMLVSIAIGLVILAAVGAAYVNSSNLTRQREDRAQVEDPIHTVMQLLRWNLSHAGYVDLMDVAPTNNSRPNQIFVPGNPTTFNMFARAQGTPVGTPLGVLFPGLSPVFGCDGAMNSTPNAIATAAPPTALACGSANTATHSLQVAYQALPTDPTLLNNSLSAPNANRGDGLDCLNQSAVVRAGTTVTVVINRFYVKPNGAGQASDFLCAGSGNSTPQPLVTGIEEFILRYQVSAQATATSTAASGGQRSDQPYMTATQVANLTSNPLGWAGVTAVEVCLIAATNPANGATTAGTTQAQLVRPTCQRKGDGSFANDLARAAGDTRLWKRHVAVVALRNALYATP